MDTLSVRGQFFEKKVFFNFGDLLRREKDAKFD